MQAAGASGVAPLSAPCGRTPLSGPRAPCQALPGRWRRHLLVSSRDKLLDDSLSIKIGPTNPQRFSQGTPGRLDPGAPGNGQRSHTYGRSGSLELHGAELGDVDPHRGAHGGSHVHGLPVHTLGAHGPVLLDRVLHESRGSRQFRPTVRRRAERRVRSREGGERCFGVVFYHAEGADHPRSLIPLTQSSFLAAYSTGRGTVLSTPATLVYCLVGLGWGGSPMRLSPAQP